MSEGIRDMVRETELSVKDLVYPIFVVPGQGVIQEVKLMPGVFRYSADMLPPVAKELKSLGIPAVLLFGVPEKKDSTASEAFSNDGAVQKAIATIKEAEPSLVVITDVCLCAYTDHGHCGLIKGGVVDNDSTLEVLAKVALSHAVAGADVVAPSDMMDGRVLAIRTALDESGYTNVSIMAYSAKYASAFYGPFREAADSAPKFGDRKTYQMDPANSDEAIREVGLDVEEGADIVMVKPALGYLDIIRRVKETFPVPVAAYSVSGEYAMIKAASAAGAIDEERAVLEVLTSIKRAGADMIITYFARDVARWLCTFL
ncbi:Delta-aminolevulinic acid dehydratase [Fervidicola ferrireducens]|uniref:Delta-aminolevulinic acid dehydratase n=2 Tax=Fervidicola ferrireducens TaxID=520764 RepID=A0A140LB31_9FIRM|nr:Delta-aminolevulinic acid dehydratase [Fervidicola ferrireducens]